jgi:hypothetical protein
MLEDVSANWARSDYLHTIPEFSWLEFKLQHIYSQNANTRGSLQGANPLLRLREQTVLAGLSDAFGPLVTNTEVGLPLI